MTTQSAQGRVILADDHPLFRGALSTAVSKAAPGRALVETSTLAETLKALDEGRADLVCLDLHMADSSGFIGLAELRKNHPSAPVVVISASHNPYQDNGIKLFARDGYKLPDAEEYLLEQLLDDPELDAYRPTGVDIGRAWRIDDAAGRYSVFAKSAFPRSPDPRRHEGRDRLRQRCWISGRARGFGGVGCRGHSHWGRPQRTQHQ